MKIDESVWSSFQQYLGYTDEEMKLFRRNPRNEEVLLKAPALNNKTIIVEVVESHGCNSQHQVGDKFYFDGAGNLLTTRCPKRVCMYALAGLDKVVFGVHELFYAGIDPDKMLFKRTGCADVGVQCGGWGRIVMKVTVKDRD